ncbi:hypothetical protein V6N13_026275 [Hibiscus sabdariffa]
MMIQSRCCDDHLLGGHLEELRYRNWIVHIQHALRDGDGSASSDDTETQEPDLPCRKNATVDGFANSIKLTNGITSRRLSAFSSLVLQSVAVYDLFMIYPIINPTKPNNTTSMNDRPPPLLLVSRFNSS